MSAPDVRATVETRDASAADEPRAQLRMIWAQDAARGIGLNGDMPWHLPEDMAHFRAATRGFPVIMGRIQWESLEPRFRPLPGRENIVLTRDEQYAAPGATVVTRLEEALDLVAGRAAWIIGGGQVYREAMPHAQELVITTIDQAFETDVWAPEIGPEWQIAERSPSEGWTTAANGMRFAITRYVRAPLSSETVTNS